MYPQFPQDHYDPYFWTPPIYPMPIIAPKPSLLQSMKYSLGQMNLSSTIKTAQKTLYTANQIIPIIYQLRPVLHNAKTAFRVVKAVKQFDLDDIDADIEQNVQATNDNTVFENMMPTSKKA